VEVQQRLQQAGEDFKSAICVAVRAHLHHQFEIKINDLSQCDLTDQDIIDHTAHRMVKRLHRRKISDNMIKKPYPKSKEELEIIVIWIITGMRACQHARPDRGIKHRKLM